MKGINDKASPSPLPSRGGWVRKTLVNETSRHAKHIEPTDPLRPKAGRTAVLTRLPT